MSFPSMNAVIAVSKPAGHFCIPSCLRQTLCGAPIGAFGTHDFAAPHPPPATFTAQAVTSAPHVSLFVKSAPEAWHEPGSMTAPAPVSIHELLLLKPSSIVGLLHAPATAAV